MACGCALGVVVLFTTASLPAIGLREREANANMGVRRYMAGKTIKQTHVHKQAASIVRSLALAAAPKLNNS